MGEDDAVPGLVGRGHSSAALHHEKGQVRTGQAVSSLSCDWNEEKL